MKRTGWTTGVQISVKYIYTDIGYSFEMGLVLVLVLGTCPGPLEMSALTVNGSRHKALLRYGTGAG